MLDSHCTNVQLTYLFSQCSMHSLEYVSPSSPHTGLYSRVHPKSGTLLSYYEDIREIPKIKPNIMTLYLDYTQLFKSLGVNPLMHIMGLKWPDWVYFSLSLQEINFIMNSMNSSINLFLMITNPYFVFIYCLIKKLFVSLPTAWV